MAEFPKRPGQVLEAHIQRPCSTAGLRGLGQAFPGCQREACVYIVIAECWGSTPHHTSFSAEVGVVKPKCLASLQEIT